MATFRGLCQPNLSGSFLKDDRVEWLKNNIEVVVYGRKSRREKRYLLVPNIENFHK